MVGSPEHTAFLRFRSDGDPAALGEVFDRTAPKLLLLAAHLTPAGIEAQDLLQGTFVVAIESAADFDPEQAVLPWLTGILTNQARAAGRKARRIPDPDRLGHGQKMPEDPLDAAANREFGAAFVRAVETLTPEHRRALLLHVVHGLSSSQIAHTEGCPPATIKSRVQRAKELLRRALPAGFAAAAPLAMTASTLAAVRGQVLAHARQAMILGASATVLGGGTLLVKKLYVGLAVAALALLAVLLQPFLADDREPIVPATGSATELSVDRRSPETHSRGL